MHVSILIIIHVYYIRQSNSVPDAVIWDGDRYV